MNPMINQINNPMYDFLRSEQQRIQHEEKAYHEAKAAIQFAKHKFEALTPQQKQKLLKELVPEICIKTITQRRQYPFV